MTSRIIFRPQTRTCKFNSGEITFRRLSSRRDLFYETYFRKFMLPSRLFSLRIKGLGSRYLCSSNMANLKGSALVILAEGAEEMEAVITADVLRRGKVSHRALNLLVYLNHFGDNFENSRAKGS